jgi:transposase
MRAYSQDLRERVLADCDRGRPTQEVADTFSVSPAWVRRLKQRRRESGETGPRRGKTGPPAKLADQQAALQQLVQEQPDATLEELRGKLAVAVSLTTLWRGLKALGITLKKSSPCG